MEEIADTLPPRLGRWLSRSRLSGRIIGELTRNGMVVNTTSIIGFTTLWLAAFGPLRPRSLRLGREQAAIDAWLDRAATVTPTNTTWPARSSSASAC